MMKAAMIAEARPAQIKPAMLDWLVEQVADRGAERTRQDERCPE
jgi:hypothetical protein